MTKVSGDPEAIASVSEALKALAADVADVSSRVGQAAGDLSSAWEDHKGAEAIEVLNDLKESLDRVAEQLEASGAYCATKAEQLAAVHG